MAKYGPLQLVSKGSFVRTGGFLNRVMKLDIRKVLSSYGEKGVAALREATPKDTGKTANSWYYKVNTYADGASVEWWNSNVNDGVPIAIIIQYGHGTGWGGYVPPVDYINPALSPIFDEISKTVWEEVSRG